MPAHGREIDWPGCLGGSGPKGRGEEGKKEHDYDSTQAPAEQQQPRADTDRGLRRYYILNKCQPLKMWWRNGLTYYDGTLGHTCTWDLSRYDVPLSSALSLPSRVPPSAV